MAQETVMDRMREENAVHRITLALGAAGIAWGLIVAIAAGSGVLRSLDPLLIGPLVALGIAMPVTAYFLSPTLKAYVHTVGPYPLTVLHVWRIPAALVFFWYGAHGALPPVFWILAGGGDLVSGMLALPLLRGPVGRGAYLSKHLFGFTDFAVAVGTGLTLTLLHDPRMAPIRDLPLAFIPLFGVGISGASHIIALHLLWATRGTAPAASLAAAATAPAPIV
jgi:hypothetical protein